MRKCFFRSFHSRVFAAEKSSNSQQQQQQPPSPLLPSHGVFVIFFFGVFVSVSFTPALWLFFFLFVHLFVGSFIRWIHRFHFSIAAFFNFPFRSFLFLSLSLHITHLFHSFRGHFLSGMSWNTYSTIACICLYVHFLFYLYFCAFI